MTSPPIKHTHRESLLTRVSNILHVTDKKLNTRLDAGVREVLRMGETPEEQIALLRGLSDWCEHHISRVEAGARDADAHARSGRGRDA